MRVLIVTGPALANLIAVTLRHGNYETRATVDPNECQRLIREWQPDLAMINVDRHEDAMEMAIHAAGGAIPIVALTRRRETGPKLRAYERGADDVIEVPFTLDEIIARPYAVMRRTRGIIVPLVPKITLGGRLQVDLIEQSVVLDGAKPLELTPIQQTLLYLLAANAGEILTREMLLNSVWGGAFQIESNVVDRHIRELRVKLEDDWRTPRYIETIAGKGYRFRHSAIEEPAARGDEVAQ